MRQSEELEVAACKGIMGLMYKNEGGVHQRLILDLIVGGHKSTSVVKKEGFQAMAWIQQKAEPVDPAPEDHVLSLRPKLRSW